MSRRWELGSAIYQTEITDHACMMFPLATGKSNIMPKYDLVPKLSIIYFPWLRTLSSFARINLVESEKREQLFEQWTEVVISRRNSWTVALKRYIVTLQLRPSSIHFVKNQKSGKDRVKVKCNIGLSSWYWKLLNSCGFEIYCKAEWKMTTDKTIG